MPVDHFSLHVPQEHLEQVVSFLVDSLQAIGFKEYYRPIPTVVGMGDTTPYIWIAGVDPKDVDAKTVMNIAKRQHTGFVAQNHEQVKQFHEAALKAGGTDEGAPGFRPQFGPHYYAAFVRDPVCGINFELVCKNAECGGN